MTDPFDPPWRSRSLREQTRETIRQLVFSTNRPNRLPGTCEAIKPSYVRVLHAPREQIFIRDPAHWGKKSTRREMRSESFKFDASRGQEVNSQLKRETREDIRSGLYEAWPAPTSIYPTATPIRLTEVEMLIIFWIQSPRFAINFELALAVCIVRMYTCPSIYTEYLLFQIKIA